MTKQEYIFDDGRILKVLDVGLSYIEVKRLEELHGKCRVEREESRMEFDILDKLRAEIESHCGLTKENHCKYCSYCNSVMGVREIIEIIDKYTGVCDEMS